MCKHCYIVKRGKIRYVYCKETPKHKQRQGYHTMVHGYMGDNCLLCNVTTDLPSLYNKSSISSARSNSNIELMSTTRSISFSSTVLDRTMLHVMNNTNVEYKIGTQVHDTNEEIDIDITSSPVNLMKRVAINYVPQLGLFSILNPVK